MFLPVEVEAAAVGLHTRTRVLAELACRLVEMEDILLNPIMEAEAGVPEVFKSEALDTGAMAERVLQVLKKAPQERLLEALGVLLEDLIKMVPMVDH